MSSSCCVCTVPNSNYKCPKCRQPYCSVACSKKHREIPGSCLPASFIPKATPTPTRRREEEAEKLEESNPVEKPKRKFETDTEDAFRHRLRREHFEKIALKLPLLEKLRSERLLETLRAIDSAPEGEEGGEEESALEIALKNSDFRQFAEEVLDTINGGTKEEED